MSIYGTEFPVNATIEKAKFVASILAWVRGIQKSRVLDSTIEKDFYEDEVNLKAQNGETLSIKSYEANSTSVFGARHELPDNEGRIWRTEIVYTSQPDGQSYIRIKGQCVAKHANAHVITPKKPYIINQLIEDGWGYIDNKLRVEPNVKYLDEDDVGLAVEIISGSATYFLPTIYVSRDNKNNCLVDLPSLQRKFAGVCHIVVEPDRKFSFALMEAAKRRNPYGGAIGIFSPDGRELFRTLQPSRQSLMQAEESVNRFLSSMAAKKGWEWQHLQEEQSKKLRTALLLNSKEDIDQYVEYFDSEMAAKNEEIENLQSQILELQNELTNSVRSVDATCELLPEELKGKIGPELYAGEFSDRLKSIIDATSAQSDTSLHPRTKRFSEILSENTQYSGRASALIHQIKSSCKHGNEMPKLLGHLLSSFGYQRTNDGKHLKFIPPQDLFGLEIEVLPSTPSDSQRGGRNRGQDVIRSFGLKDLK